MSPNDWTSDPKGYAGDIHLILAEALDRHTKDPGGLAGVAHLEDHFSDDVVGWYGAAVGLLAVAGNLLNELAAWKLLMEGTVVSIQVDQDGYTREIRNETGSADELIQRWIDSYKLSMMEKLMEEDG